MLDTQFLDIKYIREHTEKIKLGLRARGKNELIVDDLLRKYDEWTRTLQVYEELRHRRSETARGGQYSEAGKQIKVNLKKAEEENFAAWQSYEELAKQIPNIPVEGVPEGGEDRNEVIDQKGEIPKFKFTPKDHVELGKILDIIDIPRAVKVSGSRFGYLKNEGAFLEFALVQFAMETLFKEGFNPIVPPALIKKEITEGLGYWQEGGNENYYLVRDYQIEGDEKGQPLDLYLVGTGEHSVVPMHAGEVFNEKDLPKKYVAFSPSFRREAGSYGRDVHGILRVHQFDKVEMVSFIKPEDDEKERRKLLDLAKGLVESLGLPYRVVKLASGDLGFPTAETIDIETWIPSQNRYRETHSISTTTDFQARRLNIRYEKQQTKPYVHILNGTAFAIGRMIIAVVENYQQEDGSVKIPEVLQKYTGFSEIKPK